MAEDQRATTGAYEARLTLSKLAPSGALAGCPGQLEVDIDHHEGSGYISPCVIEVSVFCDAKGCWWSRSVSGPITPDLMRAAEFMHFADQWKALTATAARAEPVAGGEQP